MGNSTEYMAQFEELLACKYSSEATRRNYSSHVRRFVGWCRGQTEKNPSVLVRRYILQQLQGAEAKTVNLHRAAIVTFFRLVKGVELGTDDVPRRREPKKLPKVIDANSIHEAIRKTTNIKHRLELSLFYGCGARLHEMKYLQKKNVRVKEHLLWLSDTKGKKERIIPIPASMRETLYAYIQDMKPEDFVFGGICKRSFQKVVASAFTRVGVSASPHMLRHSFATHQLIGGSDIYRIQSWMGHSSIKTTEIYITLSKAQLSQSVDLLSENYTNQTGS